MEHEKNNLVRPPFTRLNENKDRDQFNIRLNENERATLEIGKAILEQTKDSTALKQLAFIGTKALQEEKVAYILRSIFKNKRLNQRMGINDYEQY